MNIHDAIADVLGKAGKPIPVREIARRVTKGKLCELSGKNQERSIGRVITGSIRKHGTDSPFLRYERGIYGFRKNKLTALDAAELVLRKFAKRKPMHCRDIAEKAMQENWFTSRTSRSDTLGWRLSHHARQDIKKREERGDSARFTNPSICCLGLAEWKHKSIPPAHPKKTPRVIYVLSNKAYEGLGLLKIGITKDGESLEKRMGDLYNTSVPFPFRCEYAIRVDNAADRERWLHRVLRGRAHQQREFYQLDVEDVIEVLKGHGEDVTPAPNSPDSHGKGVSRSEIQSGRRILQRRPPMRLSELGISPGATLSADRSGSNEKCVFVRGDMRDDIVKFRGKETTFTKATKQLLDNPKWQPRPARHWRYKERPLVEIYDAKYSSKK